jgi:hypothetical protein
MSSATPTNRVVCVHGVCRHRKNYHRCWERAIAANLHNAADFEFVEVRWNPKDNDAPHADCEADFPSGWIEVEIERGRQDARQYLFPRRRPNSFREHALEECREALVTQANLPGGGVHVIGHSLGSVVAYQALHRLVGRLSAKTLITVGSVLGFDYGVMPLLEREGLGPGEKLKRPPVERWYNLMDTRDFVYQLTEEKVSDEVESRPGDVDMTGDLFDARPRCPGLPPIDPRPILEIDHESVCAHLYYFHKESKAAKMIAAALEGRPLD